MEETTPKPITWVNMDDIPPGAKILYGGGRYGILQKDPRFTGGVKCDGMSLHYIMSNYDSVFYVV